MNIVPIARQGLCCTLIGLILSVGGVALADKAVDKAEKQLADLRFDEAKDTATTALKKGTRGSAEVVDLYMLLGVVSASMGKNNDAINNFHNALSINLEAKLAPGASPKLSEPFDTAKAKLEGANPITIEYEAEDDQHVVVTISSDPANLVGGAALLFTLDGEEQVKKGRGRDTVNMKIPEGATDLRIVAVDLYGNQVNEAIDLNLGAEGREQVGGAGVKKASRPGRPIHTRWQLYAGLAVGAALGGGYFGFKSKGFIDDAEALEDGTEFSRAKQLEDFAKKKALYANISFVAAALLAGTTYWIYTTNSGGVEKAASTTTSIAPYLTPEEVGIAAAIQF
jgi:hypothetical protein